MDNKFKRIFNEVLNRIANFYFYFLAFYVASLIFSLFLESWKLFFYWPAFHLSVIVFGALTLMSEKGKEFIQKFQIPKSKGAIFKIVFIFLISSLIGLFQIFIFFIYGQIQKSTKNDFIKIAVITAILGFALYKGIDVTDFVILAYGVVSVLFVMEDRISAAIALAFLASIPIFLILENSVFAEKMAVFAYYFLIIAVLTQIREFWNKEDEKQELSTKF